MDAVRRHLVGSIVVPYPDATATTVYHGYHTQPAFAQPYLYRNNTNISPVVAGMPYGPRFDSSFRGITVPDESLDTLMLIGNGYQDTNPVGVFLTRNARAAAPTWTTIEAPLTSVRWRGAYGVRANAFYLIGLNGGLGYSDGVTIDDRSVAGAAGTVVGIAGGGA